MKSRKHLKLKRNPLVRFIRGIFRLLQVLLRPTKSHRRQAPIAVNSLEDLNNIATHSFDQDQLITVGELLDRVKWQSPQINIQPKISISNDARTQDFSRN
jgi:hypothetical protein